MTTICVLGAAGLVGSAVVERLLQNPDYTVKPVIRSAGSAWRLTRRNLDLVQADQSDPAALDAAIAGADIVVNCAKVAEPKILDATNSLVNSCKKHGVDRLVHLSTVAVYGETPKPDSVYEDARPAAEKRSYGDFKTRQDSIIQSACAKGDLRASVLCIPNVSGIYSPYLMFILDLIESGNFALVNGGNQPSMLCDVQNVAQAIELAFSTEQLDGSRTFIMDREPTTWKDVVNELLPLATDAPLVRQISIEDTQRQLTNTPPFIRSAFGTARQVTSLPEVKRLVKQNITLRRSFIRWRERISHLPKGPQTRIMSLLRGGNKPTQPTSDTLMQNLDPRALQHQLRGVRHSIEKAERTLGYEPEVSFEQSMQAFRKWYKAVHGLDGNAAHLIAELDRQQRQTT